MDIFLHFDERQSTASLQKKQRAFPYSNVILLNHHRCDMGSRYLRQDTQ